MALENISMVTLPATSHIAEAGYDPVARVVMVRYRRDGRAGLYHGPTQEEFNAMINDPHPGSYALKNFKPRYGYERL